MKYTDTDTDTGPFETYLHIQECRSGEEYTMEITPRMKLDIERLVKRWVKNEYGGELRVSGFEPRLEGEYYARIITDWRKPDTILCWASTGFWTETTY